MSIATLYDRYFVNAEEPELEERSAALFMVADATIEDLTITAAILLTDACYHYGYKSPF